MNNQRIDELIAELYQECKKESISLVLAYTDNQGDYNPTTIYTGNFHQIVPMIDYLPPRLGELNKVRFKESVSNLKEEESWIRFK